MYNFYQKFLKIFKFFVRFFNLKNIFSIAYCLCPLKVLVTYGPPFGIWPILILAILEIVNYYNSIICLNSLFRVDCIVHTVRSIQHYCALGTMRLCTFQGLTSTCSAVRWDTNQHIKPHYIILYNSRTTRILVRIRCTCTVHTMIVHLHILYL